MGSSTGLWSPSSVERPYSYIGYSHIAQRTINMQVYSLTLSPKSFNLVDVLAVSSYTARTYSNMWLNSTSTDPAAASAGALAVGSKSGSAGADVEGDDSVVYPIIILLDVPCFQLIHFYKMSGTKMLWMVHKQIVHSASLPQDCTLTMPSRRISSMRKRSRRSVASSTWTNKQVYVIG